MEKAERVAIGRFVMRTKEYLAAVRARDGALALSTMRFADEVRPQSQVPTGGAKKPAKKQIDNAVAVIEELSTEWKPDSYTDCYRKRLSDVIERKRKGGKIEAPDAEPEPKPAEDLMAALERTLANVKAGREPRAPDDGAEEDGKAKKSSQKKSKAKGSRKKAKAGS
jgi:DNA end-binding protein Ku